MPPDDDEPERQQPDEDPVRKRAGHDPAADVAVALHEHVDRINRAVKAAQLLATLRGALDACAQLVGPAPHRSEIAVALQPAHREEAPGRRQVEGRDAVEEHGGECGLLRHAGRGQAER